MAELGNKPSLFLKNYKNKAFVLKNDEIRHFLYYFSFSAIKMYFLHSFSYFSHKNVLKMSPKLSLHVLINFDLIKKRVCRPVNTNDSIVPKLREWTKKVRRY